MKLLPSLKTQDWTPHHTVKQAAKFILIGILGTLINGLVYSLLSQFEIFNGIPWKQLFSSLPILYHTFSFLNSITWAWGIGILVACIFNFILNKIFVFGV